MVIITTHVYPKSSKVLFPWKLVNVLRWMHEDGMVFAWGLALLALVYREMVEIQLRCRCKMECSLLLQI